MAYPKGTKGILLYLRPDEILMINQAYRQHLALDRESSRLASRMQFLRQLILNNLT